MQNTLAGRVAIITGAGRGIGRGVAEVFAVQGCRVIVATRTESHGREVVQAIQQAGGQAELYATELPSRQAVNDLVKHVLAAHGRLDIVVHNAAYIPVQRIHEMTDEALDQAFAVNVKAGVWLAQAALEPMQAQGGGRLLYTSSVTAQRTYFGAAPYSITKAGLNGFIRSAALELGQYGITVNGVEPGIIETDALKKHDFSPAEKDRIAAYIPLKRFGTPEEIAETMLFLASDAGRYITGQTIVVDGGMILPENGAFMVDS